ncbi:MAG: HEAT repeat domain-containing protein [Polyangiaceae bacterium]|nr:HEAT repeat domain-containing protein [Polyangiaceae bacterium]
MHSRSFVSRLFGAALVALALSTASLSASQDSELTASDFRVRVQAALRLGRSGPSARTALEQCLRDTHPAVRVACAVSLGNIGDVAAIPALEQAMKSESVAGVKAAMKETVDKLRTSGASKGFVTPSAKEIDRAKYVVELGAMRNNTGIGSADLDAVMKQAARAKATTIQGAVVVDVTNNALIKRASAKRIPVLLIDASLTRLTQSTAKDGGVTVSAQVDLSIRKVPQHVLCATASGTASATGDPRTGQEALPELQHQAVGHAVESAMSTVGSSIVALAN